jgi:hypothetical protein
MVTSADRASPLPISLTPLPNSQKSPQFLSPAAQFHPTPTPSLEISPSRLRRGRGAAASLPGASMWVGVGKGGRAAKNPPPPPSRPGFSPSRPRALVCRGKEARWAFAISCDHAPRAIILAPIRACTGWSDKSRSRVFDGESPRRGAGMTSGRLPSDLGVYRVPANDWNRRSHCRGFRRRSLHRTHNGRSALAAATALDAPLRTLTTASEIGPSR